MRKKLWTIIVCLLGAVCFAFLSIDYSTFGNETSADDLARYQQSENFDQATKRFINADQYKIDRMLDSFFDIETLWQKLFAEEVKYKTPDRPLPQNEIDLSSFLKNKQETQIIWLGHSSFMISMSGKLILIDPVFGNAGPFWFVGERFRPPVIALEDLPPIDYIIISHDHFDHLEMDTVKHFRDSEVKFVAPLGVGRHLNYWGIDQDRIMEKDWWGVVQLDGLKVTITPSRHYSGRAGFIANDTLWASFVVENDTDKLYFSGDSGYGPHFREIGERLGPFDMAFMENGQYADISREIHMHPEDVIKAFSEINAKQLVPMHWAVFALSTDHSWFDPPTDLTAFANQTDTNLYVPQIGEVMRPDQGFTFYDWWSSIAAAQKSADQ